MPSSSITIPPPSLLVNGSGGFGSATWVTTSAIVTSMVGGGAAVMTVPSWAGLEILPLNGQPSQPVGRRSSKVLHKVGPSDWPRICPILRLVSSCVYPSYPLLQVWISSSPSTAWQRSWMQAYQWGSLIQPRVSRILASCAQRVATFSPEHGGKSRLMAKSWLIVSVLAST